MRPKKVILVVRADPDALSVLTYSLQINGYKVLPASTAADAVNIFTNSSVDLVLTDFAIEAIDGNQLITRLKQINNQIRMVQVCDLRAMEGQIFRADALISKYVSTAELLERMKIWTARKRGPRKETIPTRKVAECTA